jgi:hypothetical protein
MMIYAIRNPEYLHVTDEDGTQFLGCEQEWFGTLWQRRSGCGPTVASNLMLYLHRRGPSRFRLMWRMEKPDACP